MTSTSLSDGAASAAVRDEMTALSRRLIVAWAHRHDGWPLSRTRFRAVRAYYRLCAEARRFGRLHPEVVEQYVPEIGAR